MITDYQWIDDNSELEQLILSLKKSDEVAFDSEFERINTFFPKPALFQLNINNQFYLIDMKEISNHQVFRVLLDNIILHSGSEDLEIVLNLTGRLPSKIFDTQIAASLCGYGLHFSYQNSVKEMLGVELSKAHSRSDWLKRPLSEAQLNYALEDVIYLHEMKELLSEQLHSLGRESWYHLLIQQKLESIQKPNHVGKTFLKIAKSSRFDENKQKLLLSLLQWREKMAIKRNKPRPWILKNSEIVDIVKFRPKSDKEMVSQIGLYPKFVQYNGQSIRNLYEQSEVIGTEELPQVKNLTAEQKQTFNQFKATLLEQCDKLNIPMALVVNISDLKSLVANGQELSDIKMWKLIQETSA